jgi:hypothetical protein
MPKNLLRNPVHLGRGALATIEPAFTGMERYEAYEARHQPMVRTGGW